MTSYESSGYDPSYPSYPTYAQQPPPPRRPSRRWRAAAAGAVAGGVLATAVAVPTTWALARDGHAGTPTITSTGPGATAPDTTEDPGTTDPGQGTGQDDGSDSYGFGGPELGQQDLGQGSQAKESKATDAESRGVVLIDTTLTDGEAAGTGLVLDSSGVVLTNYHVVEGSTTVKVTIASDGTTYGAKVLGTNPTADVALLQLDGAAGLTTVDVDDDEDPAVSDEITAIGNAEGQGYLSASAGSVVALGQSITTQSTSDTQGEDLTDLIQTNAYVVGGYSGGALLDDEGEVVGITTAASSGGAAESYGVPIDDALKVADEIEDGDESAEVRIGPAAYIGVAVSAQGSGLQIGEVEDGTAASEAGIGAGDTLTAIDGTEVTSYDALQSALAAHEPGDRVTLHWTDTGGGSQKATVTLGESPVN